MEVHDIFFVVSLITLYAATFLSYAFIGNLIVGHKIRTGEDFVHPFSKHYKHNFGTRNRPIIFYFLYYLLFLGLLIGLTLEMMSLRSSFQAWVDKLMGTRDREVATAASSRTFDSNQEASTSKSAAGTSDSETSLTGKSSKSKAKKKKPKSLKSESSSPILGLKSSHIIGPRPSQLGRKPSQIGRRPSQIGRRPSQIGHKPSQLGPKPSQTKTRPSFRLDKTVEQSGEK